MASILNLLNTNAFAASAFSVPRGWQQNVAIFVLGQNRAAATLLSNHYDYREFRI